MSTDLTDATFGDTLDNIEGISVVQFTAPWCGPCRMLKPRLAELAEDLSLNYYTVNIDENSELARQFRIMSIPTLQWYKNGVLANTTVGVLPYTELKAIVEAL